MEELKPNPMKYITIGISEFIEELHEKFPVNDEDVLISNYAFNYGIRQRKICVSTGMYDAKYVIRFFKNGKLEKVISPTSDFPIIYIYNPECFLAKREVIDELKKTIWLYIAELLLD